MRSGSPSPSRRSPSQPTFPRRPSRRGRRRRRPGPCRFQTSHRLRQAAAAVIRTAVTMSAQVDAERLPRNIRSERPKPASHAQDAGLPTRGGVADEMCEATEAGGRTSPGWRPTDDVLRAVRYACCRQARRGPDEGRLRPTNPLLRQAPAMMMSSSLQRFRRIWCVARCHEGRNARFRRFRDVPRRYSVRASIREVPSARWRDWGLFTWRRGDLAAERVVRRSSAARVWGLFRM